MICPKCGKQLADDATFCGNCGTKIENIQGKIKTVCCPKCGKQLSADDAFCDECGFSLNSNTKKFPELMKKKGGLIACAGVAGAAVLGVLILVSVQFSSTKPSDEVPSKLVYFKDDSMMVLDLKRKKAKPVELTSSFSEDFKYRGVSSDIFLSKDEKYVLYKENYDANLYTYDLYVARFPRLTDGKKVDSKIRSYVLLDNNTILYNKKDSLFLYNGKENIRFARNVEHSDYWLDKDQKNVLWKEYEKGDYTYYFQDIAQKNKAVKIDDEVDSFYFNEEMTRFFSRKENNLYIFDRKGNRERIAKDISQVVAFDKKTGMIFYTKTNTEEIPYSEFVYDDTHELNERIQKQLEQEKYTYSSSELYLFDGNNEQLIEDNYAYSQSYFWGEKGQCHLYMQNPDIKSIKIPWSTMKNDSWKSVVKQAINEERKLILLSGNQKIGEYEDIIYDSCQFNEESGKLYLYTFDIDGKNETIWEVSLYGNDAGKLNEYDYGEDIVLLFANDKGLGYLKDIEDGEGDFYFDKEEIEIEVSFVYKIEDSNRASVYSDFDFSDNHYTLSIWNGKNIVNVSEEANFSECAKDGTVVLLSNYDSRRREGDLLYFDGRELRLLDEEVSGFSKRRGSSTIHD